MWFVALFILPLASAYGDCPETTYTDCWSADPPQMWCWGGMDADGCSLQDSCMDMYSAISGEDGNACYNTCPVTCNENEVYCDYGMDWNGCWMGGYCSSSWDECPATCYNYCNGDSIYCDMGYDDNGCWMGNYCAYEWDNGEAVCPGVCYNYCAEGENYCDEGTDSNGCWLGNWCAPEGTECPVKCPDVEPVECDWENEMTCWGGNDYNGCAMPDTCLSYKSEWAVGLDGEACWNTCDTPCNYDDGQVWCDNGYDYNGCSMGSYCAYGYDTEEAHCYAVCGTQCAEGETWCSVPSDANGCWMGNWCAPEGMECTTTYGTYA